MAFPSFEGCKMKKGNKNHFRSREYVYLLKIFQEEQFQILFVPTIMLGVLSVCVYHLSPTFP